MLTTRYLPKLLAAAVSSNGGKTRKKTKGRRCAAAAVEFAIIAPLLFTLILGIIEFGRAMMVIELLNNAARNGARIGALAGSDTSAITTAVNSSLTTAGVNGANTPTVLVNGASADASTATTGDVVSVSVTTPASKISWLPGTIFLTGDTLGTAVVMRRE
jgi:Flp pilus assembly protein TadG